MLLDRDTVVVVAEAKVNPRHETSNTKP